MNKSSSKAKGRKTTILKLDHVTKSYTSGSTIFYALKDISLTIDSGDFMAITGPSGSGKSTLMHIIGLLDHPSSGQVILEGQNISSLNETSLAQLRNKTLGFVFQQFNLLAKTSSLENIILPLLYSDIPQSNRQNLGLEMLSKVNLSDKISNTPAQLSGGEQQRVAIARALVNDPKIILADEPTGNLDSKTGKSIMELFKNLHLEGRTIVLVTHDINLAKQASRVIVIRDGQIVK